MKKDFNQELRGRLSTELVDNYSSFENVFIDVLNRHASIKKNVIRANHAPYVTKALRKAIMKRSQLDKIYFKKRTQESFKKYKKQKKYCSRLYKRERKSFFESIDSSEITDNKTFWKNIQPFFSEKRKTVNKITLVNENEDILSNDKVVADEINSFFTNATKNLGITENTYIVDISNDITDPVNKAIYKFKNHPSILLIQRKVANDSTFSFNEAFFSEIEKELRSLNPNKAYTFKNIPPKILKESREYCSDIQQKLFNKTLSNKEFPDEFKLADVTTIYKKDDPNKSKNYRPVSVLPVVSKVFEKIIHDQISQYINSFLTPYLCGYRKGFSTQQALLSLIEKWKIVLDSKGYGGAVLMDLSKAFDTINHDLLIAKLHAYGFSKESLKLIKSYLSNCWQRTKVNLSFSSWSELILGVPQGSVLGPLLFNIYINDLFYLTELTDVCNYADDTTFHACDSNLDNLIRRLEHDSVLAIEWFESNYMKLNQDKCHFLLSGHKHEVMFAKIGHSKIWEN